MSGPSQEKLNPKSRQVGLTSQFRGCCASGCHAAACSWAGAKPASSSARPASALAASQPGSTSQSPHLRWLRSALANLSEAPAEALGATSRWVQRRERLAEYLRF